ncbi:DUF1848 domain-containing protein [Acidaminococcus timonensis]|uniref:DUF1848 domain-containing protein n=1 Tax=Acidaminococcus timonensis TaxID=1871002 RepID=UPI0026F37762|nr:DUF1848 domain-containing protein [Acidaminococcus timonensis]
MIINTGQRTDIPAFYARWFLNRLQAGFVCVRNPYNPSQVSRYRLSPDVVDCIGFCTKNPLPMLPYLDRLQDYGQYWYVSITPYGRDLEPNVPDKHLLLDAFRQLSQKVGKLRVGWRYDPILLTDRYTPEYHLRAFRTMAEALAGFTDTVVISFVDCYPKVLQNFPELQAVPRAVRLQLGQELVRIAADCGMGLRTCAEGDELAPYGADCSGCMKLSDYERAIGKTLLAPKRKGARAECACYLGCDIGAYSTCRHFCRYCYANGSQQEVLAKCRQHDPESPFLIGNYEKGDQIHDVPQKNWVEPELSLFP